MSEQEENSMTEGNVSAEPSPLAGREIVPSQYVSSPIFSAWYDKYLGKNLPETPEHPIVSGYRLQNSATGGIKVWQVYFESIVAPNQDRRTADIHFWMNMKTAVCEKTRDELNKVVKEQVSLICDGPVRMNVSAQVNQVPSKVMGEIRLINRARKPDMRAVLHYVGHSIPGAARDSLFFFPDTHMSLMEIMENLGDISCLIVDRDNAGGLLHVIEEFSIGKDMIAFLSCMEGETMPRSTDYPSDIFTACLTTPARVAMLWHSRHYYCFRSGPLQPLSVLFLEEISDPEKRARAESILAQVRAALRATVATIAFERLDRDLYVKLFASDPILADVTTNFILAKRILRCFGITPVSYPDLPDMSDAPEWHTFDLRLDVALYMLMNDSLDNKHLSYHHFLSQTLDSIRNFVDMGIVSDNPQEFAFFPEIIADKELCEEACGVLAKYLDRSIEAVEYCMHFPIPKALADVLLSKRVTNVLLFCLIKFCAYSPEVRSIFGSQFVFVILEVLMPNIHGPHRHLVLILLSLLVRGNLQRLTLSPVMSCMHIDPASFAGETKIWALFFVTSVIEKTGSPVDSLLRSIIPLTDDADPVLQICLLAIMNTFIKGQGIQQSGESVKAKKQRKRTEKLVIETSLKFATSLSFLTRIELLLIINKYSKGYEQNIATKQKPFWEKIRNLKIQYSNDPSQEVRDVVRSGQTTSQVFNKVTSLLLNPILKILDNSSPSLSYLLDPVPSDSVVSVMRPTRVFCEQTSLKIRTSYHHTSCITSNLINIPTNKIGFGDKCGCVHVKSWDDDTICGDFKFTTAPITDVEWINNRGSPMIMAADTQGNCYMASVDNNFNMSYTASFRAIETPKPCHIHVAVAEWPMTLFSYIYGDGDEFFMRDIRADRLLASIKPKYGKTVGLQVIDNFSDYVAICGSDFEFYDMRVSFTNPMIAQDLYFPAFGMHVIDPSIPVFSVATDEAMVGILDLRHPEGVRTTSVPFDFDQMDRSTRAFATHKTAQTAAISHGYGITCIHLLNGRQEQIPQVASKKGSKTNVAALLYHDQRYQLSFVNERYNLVTAV